jgi:hypothetical protein
LGGGSANKWQAFGMYVFELRRSGVVIALFDLGAQRLVVCFYVWPSFIYTVLIYSFVFSFSFKRALPQNLPTPAVQSLHV